MSKRILYSTIFLAIGVPGSWIFFLENYLTTVYFPREYNPVFMITFLFFVQSVSGLLIFIKNNAYKVLLAISGGGFFADVVIKIGFFSNELFVQELLLFLMIALMSSLALADRDLDFPVAQKSYDDQETHYWD